MNPDHLEERAAEQAAAVEAVEAALDELEGRNRELDRWERVNLAHGIGAISHGLYGLAEVAAQLALTPPEGRSPRAHLSTDPLFDRVNPTVLWEALALAKRASPEPFPIFGPIVSR